MKKPMSSNWPMWAVKSLKSPGGAIDKVAKRVRQALAQFSLRQDAF